MSYSNTPWSMGSEGVQQGPMTVDERLHGPTLPESNGLQSANQATIAEYPGTYNNVTGSQVPIDYSHSAPQTALEDPKPTNVPETFCHADGVMEETEARASYEQPMSTSEPASMSQSNTLSSASEKAEVKENARERGPEHGDKMIALYGLSTSNKATANMLATASTERKNSLDYASNQEDSRTKSAVPTNERKPSWTELKTKAGKERKRLPLACIACRRKKIRCSGENPSCRHCQRSRIPCVYKVAARKAAPRIDYMTMLDRRLKRMEERIIKIVPKAESFAKPVIPRAILKPQTQQLASGKKRGADEAFGPEMEKWAKSESDAQPQANKKAEDHGISMDGAEFLPPMEIQEHLSETYFDFLYGQSYHLMHKPSYMRKLR